MTDFLIRLMQYIKISIPQPPLVVKVSYLAVKEEDTETSV